MRLIIEKKVFKETGRKKRKKNDDDDDREKNISRCKQMNLEKKKRETVNMVKRLLMTRWKREKMFLKKKWKSETETSVRIGVMNGR